ncbi:hypothetical protein [Desulforhopalus sp. 52FAK]
MSKQITYRKSVEKFYLSNLLIIFRIEAGYGENDLVRTGEGMGRGWWWRLLGAHFRAVSNGSVRYRTE